MSRDSIISTVLNMFLLYALISCGHETASTRFLIDHIVMVLVSDVRDFRHKIFSYKEVL
jgi:hypothetical protein